MCWHRKLAAKGGGRPRLCGQRGRDNKGEGRGREGGREKEGEQMGRLVTNSTVLISSNREASEAHEELGNGKRSGTELT